MSFDYRTPNLGPTGEADYSVNVVDRPEVSVISIGFGDHFTWESLFTSVKTLKEALGT
jgi:hypothetical protein